MFSGNIYESKEMRRLTGDTVRPGGLALTRRAIRYCDFIPGQRVLDIGCGPGATVACLIGEYGLNAVGLDPSEVLLAEARQHNAGLPLVRGRGGLLPFGTGVIDAVIMECVLSVAGDRAAVLAEIFRVLDSGGRLIITDIYADGDGTESENIPAGSCLGGAISREKIATELKNSDFGMTLWEDHSPLLTRLAVEIIMAYGSLGEFWSQAVPGSQCPADGCFSRPGRKPGYFLAVAEKKRKAP